MTGVGTVLLFGASGMVGQGVLRECLRADSVREVRAVVRRALPLEHPKLRQVVTGDIPAPGAHLTGVDATFDCAGVSLYAAFYAVLRPAFPLLRRVAPDPVTSTEAVGRAMSAAVTGAAPQGVVTTRAINALA